MADIFLAYSRANLRKANQFQDACAVLVVLWSKTSFKSEYVKEEAEVAKDHKKLFPVMITKCKLPYGFRGIQTLDMTSWRGDSSAPQWKRLIEDIRRKIKNPR